MDLGWHHSEIVHAQQVGKTVVSLIAATNDPLPHKKMLPDKKMLPGGIVNLTCHANKLVYDLLCKGRVKCLEPAIIPVTHCCPGSEGPGVLRQENVWPSGKKIPGGFLFERRSGARDSTALVLAGPGNWSGRSGAAGIDVAPLERRDARKHGEDRS